MSCLAHDKRFRSSFHNIINEFRNENRMPVPILRSLPNKCCTCHDQNTEIVEPVIAKDDKQFMKLNNLIERVNREKQINSKLILSLCRFIDFIESSAPVSSESLTGQEKEESDSSSDDSIPASPPNSSSVKNQKGSSSSSDGSSSSSDEEDIVPMETSKSPIRYRKKQNKKIQKPSKPIKTGTFVFLPYTHGNKTERKKPSSALLDVAKELQRKRFIGRDGRIPELEKQFDVRINMITKKTSDHVTEALEHAQKGLDQLKIHDKEKSMTMSKQQDGEWVLIRSKKPETQTNSADIEQLVDELTSQWESCLKIRKRKCDELDNSKNSARKRK